MTKKEYDPKNAVYTPDESSAYAIEAIERIRNSKRRAANLDIAQIRDYFAPVLPGQVTAIIAQTSHYKSSFMHFWERQIARQLITEGRDDEAIIHVSVEECVEEQSFLFLANETGDEAGKLARGEVQDWDRLLAASVKIASIPIYRIGDSLARAEDMPNLYLSNMVKAIGKLTSGEVTGAPIRPAAIFFDYLQAFPFDPETKTAELKDQRRLQVREDIYRLRQAAAYYQCPVVVGVQAKQQLNRQSRGNMDIPGMYDGEESSAIAQRCDRIITLYMPAKNYSCGEYITFAGEDIEITENMLFIKVAKQRGGLPSGQTWLCRVDFAKNEIAPDNDVHGG